MAGGKSVLLLNLSPHNKEGVENWELGIFVSICTLPYQFYIFTLEYKELNQRRL